MSRPSRAFGALVAMLVGCLIGVVPACAATGSAGGGTTAYDTAAYVYDVPALLSSPDTAPKDARGSPSAPEAGSWPSPASVSRDVVAANTTARAADAGGDIVGTSHNALRPSQNWIDKEVVDAYVSRLRAGERLPAIQVERMADGTEVILDGHHRYVASQITGIPVDRTFVQYGFNVGEPNWLGVSYGN